jgi:hypothetical protein
MMPRAFAWVDVENVPGVLDWVAFIFGGLGIGFTVWQLVRSRNSLNAARDALRDTQALLVRNQALFALPVFQEISESIDAAISDDSRQDLQSAFGRFAVRASETTSLLRALDRPEYSDFLSRLDTVSDEVSSSRASLSSNPEQECIVLGGTAANSVRDLAPRLNGLAVTIRNDAGMRNVNAG